MKTSVTFLGGAGSVTGSKHLVSLNGHRALLECGLFQGPRSLRERNWAPFAFAARELEAVVLSHAHLDHCGALPALVSAGFRGPIHCTSATAELARIVLLDSAKIQEEDAARANRDHTSRHRPALPLYTERDVERTLTHFQTHRFEKQFAVGRLGVAQFRTAGHILGAATVDLETSNKRIVFSGDLGRWHRPLLKDPALVDGADVLLLESTYGDRIHPTDSDSDDVLERVLCQTFERQGIVVVPAFAIGRTQEFLWTLRSLEERKRVPVVPVVLDSPMAQAVSDVYGRHVGELDPDAAQGVFETHLFEKAVSGIESMALNLRSGPMVIIAGGGMATGGRVLHHLKHRLGDARNTVLLTGYQATGTRGRALKEGAPTIDIHGETIAVRASIASVDGMSAHADQSELLRWLAGFRRAPTMTYVIHGEPQSAQALANHIHEQLGWSARPAVDQETVEV